MYSILLHTQGLPFMQSTLGISMPKGKISRTAVWLCLGATIMEVGEFMDKYLPSVAHCDILHTMLRIYDIGDAKLRNLTDF